jgi:methylated-DNA-[protein]-cysteine S-methyltransferase
MTMHFTTLETPIGELLLAGNEQALCAVQLPGLHNPRPFWTEDETPFAEAITQIEQYFAGGRAAFDLPLQPLGGNDFDHAVWKRLLQIPYGETASYGQVARDIGRPDDARAVGGANARNPIAIVVPCHRVIGSNGSLTGYAGGLELKSRLLDLEAGVQTLV